MHSPTLPNTEPANIARICTPTIPVVDWRSIRGSLGAFRSGYEEIEQFVGQLLDEIDDAWQELDGERARVESRHATTIEAPAATALVPLAADPRQLQCSESFDRRIAELEEDRYALLADVEFTRNQLAEQTKLLTEERRQAADERATWAGELRLLREAIHRQIETFNALPHTPPAAAGAHADRPLLAELETHDTNDPVLGPLLSQFRILQRDVARRRTLHDKKPE
jgi:hypothetical protein